MKQSAKGIKSLRRNFFSIITIELVLSLLLLSGCELFSTRDPETPTGSSSGQWQFPTEPAVVLDNLQNAVGRRASVDYMRSFGIGEEDILVFLPDPKTVANHPGRLDGWGYYREQKFVESLFNPAVLPLDSIASLTMEITRSSTLADSAEISASYLLHLGHTVENAPIEMEGRTEFLLNRGSDGGWRIHQWTDFRSSGAACLSDLKAQF